MEPAAGDDLSTLQRYARERDERAFATLVRRYVDLVYSAAVRRVGDKPTQPVASKEVAEPGKSDENPVSLKKAPPVVISTVPRSGTGGIDPSLKEIKVTYSKDMTDGSWSWSTWGEDTFPKTTGKPRYLTDKRTCVLPVELQPGKTYAIWLNSQNFGNFKDAGGQPAVPDLLIFETKK